MKEGQGRGGGGLGHPLGSRSGPQAVSAQGEGLGFPSCPLRPQAEGHSEEQRSWVGEPPRVRQGPGVQAGHRRELSVGASAGSLVVDALPP